MSTKCSPRSSALAIALLLSGLSLAAQDGRGVRVEPDQPSFTVASVKPNTSGSPADQLVDRPDGLVIVNLPLKTILAFAFEVFPYQIDAPSWIGEEHFDINARGERPLTTPEKRARLQHLLVDRFGLRHHRETREQAAYALRLATPGHTGPGMQPRNCATAGTFPLSCGGGIASADGGMVRLGGAPMARITLFLSEVLTRPVIDRTGLEGPFEVDLRFRPDVGLSPDITDDAKARINERPALPAALREQLGLQLESLRAPIDMLVVDAITRPTPD